MDKQEARVAAYHRLHWLWPILARPLVRRALKCAGWGLILGYFLFAGLILVLRYTILPGIGLYQADIEQVASRAVGLPVKVGQIEAGWDGLNPQLTLRNVSILDRQGRQAFALTQVESVLSWQTLVRFRPILKLLALDGPVLHVRRDERGRISVAGVETEGESDPAAAEWVLDQPHIRIRDAIIVWEDGLRKAPPLVLEDLQFALDNRGDRHRFGFSAAPPAALAARLEVRGDIRGSVGESLDDLAGKVFVELNYADLAAWRAWVDYPVRLPRGRGAVRVWGDWKEGDGRFTADLALEDLRIRLAPELPELDLATMRGRVEGAYEADHWSLAGRRLELTSLDGIRVAPMDFQADWRRVGKDGPVRGSATASQLDLDALSRLAAYLPLDRQSRALLVTHQPQGRIADLRSNWTLAGDALETYSLRARFDRLGILAEGRIPGASGLSGELEVTEKGGSLSLDSKDASLSLPGVFPEPHIPLNELRARARWSVDGKVLDAHLDRLEFASADAAGLAKGSYRRGDDGPGSIDLTASLSRADGAAVWRYMPHVVNANTRSWLRRGIVEGRAGETKLVLKGDLRDFPFRDRSKGQFLITTKAQGVKIDYAPGWPVINGVDATLSFGTGMRIEASRGSILGTQIASAVVEIPDFESAEEMLLVRGQVQGPTAEFLAFIEASPVAEKIDRFTEGMRAEGNGRLDLELDMPLRHVLDTSIRGAFQFQNNQVHVVPGLPPVGQVNGRLNITATTITAQEITGQILGGPMRLSVRNDGDRVAVTLAGTASLREARKHFDTRVFDHLAGSTPWKGEVRVRKKNADFVVESNLVGISSSLPEPFNKTAATVLPLRIEKSVPADAGKGGPGRDQIRVLLGKVAEAQILRRQEGEAMVIQRGAVAVGEPLPRLPEQGMALALTLPRADLDFWRGLRAGNGNGRGAGNDPPITGVTLRTPSLRLLGRDYSNVQVAARPRDDGWQVALSTREAAGELFWRGAGEGALQAHFRRLTVTDAAPTDEADLSVINSLPGMDVRVDDFALGEKRLGKLDLRARNERGFWNLESLSLENPDGWLKGKAQWNNVGGHHTRLAFELGANDIGKLLERLGYPGAVRQGSANLKGNLAWDGPLVNIHYPSLGGDLAVTANKGQFVKLEPGIGKLLGLISLQSLPRRLTLDFRDIFSNGFAFDTIDGKLAVKTGIMRTTGDLKIDGPSAGILMKGEVDLRQETQDLVVTVQPEMGAVFSVGALVLAHPVAGAVAAVASKLLQNPLNKVFSFQYHVTGPWSDPKIEKIGHSVKDLPATAPPTATAPSSPPSKAEEGQP